MAGYTDSLTDSIQKPCNMNARILDKSKKTLLKKHGERNSKKRGKAIQKSVGMAIQKSAGKYSKKRGKCEDSLPGSWRRGW